MCTKEQISNLFRNFSIKECKGSSDLYEYLSMKIAEDEEVLTLSSYAQVGRTSPKLTIRCSTLFIASRERTSFKNVL